MKNKFRTILSNMIIITLFILVMAIALLPVLLAVFVPCDNTLFSYLPITSLPSRCF